MTAVLWAGSSVPASTETDVAGMIGYTLAQDSTRGRVNDPAFVGLSGGTASSTVQLNNSLMYGVKRGQ